MTDDSLSDEDKTLFRQMMSEVKPLPKNKKVGLPTVEKIAANDRYPKKIKAIKTDPLIHLSDSYTQTVQAETVLSYTSPSIPNKRFAELKKGLIPWQARLDLHGLRPDEARQALIHFILEQTALAHRCLLIIHGKGGLQGEAPVLKNLVHHWLAQFTQVLAFHSAVKREGGSGALYVLLKRHRPHPATSRDPGIELDPS